MEITHRWIDGRWRQLVSPSELRAVLRRQGESLRRPPHFGPLDEWFTR